MLASRRCRYLGSVMAVFAALSAGSSRAFPQSPAAAPQPATAACPQNGSGLKLPPGFCATIFADGVGHARHLVVAPDGVVYVNTWSGRYYGNDKPHAGGFLVALKDTTGAGKADVNQRFGETVQSGGAGGTGIGLHKGALFAEINDKIVRYTLRAGAIIPPGPAVPVVTGLPLGGDHPMHPFTIDSAGSLYIDVATATNACQENNRTLKSPGIVPCTELETRGGIWRYDAGKANQAFSPAARFATGIRNAEGFAIDAAGRMFVTQHGRDQLHANWPDLYKPEAEATQPAEELLLLRQGGDYGWPECYYDAIQGKLVLAPEYGGDGGKTQGICASKGAPVAAFPAHWAPNAMALYDKQQFPTHYRDGVFIAFHGSWDRAPYPQSGYNVVFQALAADHASGKCEVFADGFAGAVASPGQAEHRPSGVAVGPDGSLFVSDDVRGRIYRIVYRGGSGAGGGALKYTACPSPTVSAGSISADDAKPPEGTHPDAGAAAETASLPVPAGATQAMIALGDRIYHGQVGGATCTGCHGSDAKGTPLGPDLTDTQWLWSDGSYPAIAKTITDGVPRPKQYRAPMPAMGGAPLSSNQVSALAAYIWGLSHRPPTTSNAPVTTGSSTSATTPVQLASVAPPQVAMATPGAGEYTKEQAQTGAQVYSESCSLCHGSRLQGGAAPALTGPAFAQALQTTYTSTSKLFALIATQMPVNDPGSLSKEQYTEVLAFILAENGYPAGAAPLDAAHLDGLALLPYPHHDAKQPDANLEIQNIGSANRLVKGALPDTARVTVSDTLLGSADSHSADWLLHGRDYSNQRFSTLKDINAGNVSSLVPTALVQTGITSSFETTPIVVNGVMYATTPVVDNKMKILAIRANSGDIIWESTYSLGNFKICCGPVNRGVAVAYGNVYVVTLDDRLIALDAASGQVHWNAAVADPALGYSETMAPQVYKGKVIVGSAGGEWPIRGFVAAFDATSGKEAWRWQATDPKSFNDDSWQRGGGMVWTTPAIDTARDLIIFSTGNPNPDLYGAGRKGDNLYTDSIVALHAGTGKLAWFFQEVPHDVWDYDAVSNVVLFDTVDHGKIVPAAGEAGKTGWFYIVNRDTGKLIRRSDAFVDQSKNMFSQPTQEGVQMLPGANGGAEWSPPAYSPLTHAVYILGMNQLMTFTTGKDPGFQPGMIRLGSAFTNVPKDPVQNGVFSAINVDTGKLAWQYKANQPLIGGALATAGNLVFMGEGDGYFDAFDATSGAKLWRFNLGAGVNAPPITYSVDGVQYIAVAAGGNFQMGFPYGDTIAIFKLAK